MTEEWKSLFIQLEQKLESLMMACRELEPKKRELRWFGQGRWAAQWKLLCTGAKDAQNHAAALIGYFEGYTARGQFQEECIDDVFETAIESVVLLSQITKRICDVVSRYRQTAPPMCEGGPKKPGPTRTLHAAIHHIHGLEYKLCALILKASKDKRRLQSANLRIQRLELSL